jgi:hypothetical protein
MRSKNSILSVLLLALVAGSIISCGGNNQKGAEVTESPQAEPVEIFQNEYVKAVKVVLEPNQELASHDGEKRVIYSLSDYSLEWTENGVKEGMKSWKAGETHAHDAGVHAAKNIGNTTAEWIAFIKKDTELPDCSSYSLDNDINSVATDFAKLLLDDENFRITEVTLPIGGEIPTHSGINRLVFALSNYKILFESDKSDSGEKSFSTGDIHWHEGCMHSLKNIGDGEARFLVISFK